jgi:hypothetical protein
MTATERTQAAARIITAHRPYLPGSNMSPFAGRQGYCRCDKEWSLLHVAKELDKAGLLCALVTS